FSMSSDIPTVRSSSGPATGFRTHIKKFLNNPDEVVEEMLYGAVKAHAAYLEPVDNSHRALVARTGPRAGKVGLVIGTLT
ncbi:3,4-dihydroxy-2-butanone kinase, partial [Rhizobium ruizarguesonis]